MSMLLPATSSTSKHFAPGLWALLDRIPRDLWPALLRGDCGFGNEPIMREAEQRGLAYSFKLRLTANVKRMIERLATQREWTNAGQGWQAKESLLRLDGWSRQRRVIILRRRVKGTLTMFERDVGPLGKRFLSSKSARMADFNLKGKPKKFDALRRETR